MEGKELIARPAVTDDPATAGPQDYVLITLKAHSVAPIAEVMQPLLGPDTAVVTAMNGIPWWYFHALPGPHANHQLKTVDPDGSLWRLIPPQRCIGCVVYPAAEVVKPGVVEHQYGNRFMLGEPDGSSSERAKRLSEALTAAGFKAPVRPRIRDDIWVKLWGNLSFNPVSALTQATLVKIATDPGTRDVIRKMMQESERVANALGVKFGIDVETRIGWAADVGEHRTSMLQDLELGRPMEIDALLSVVVEMGDLVGVDTPLLDAILALVIQRAQSAGCYR
jgi:2-dehydropantoate 2-reductase